jgi:hypothetical protein
VLTGLKHILCIIHEKKGMCAEVDNMTVAADSLMLCIPDKLTHHAVEDIIRAMVIAGDIGCPVLYAVIVKH